jgi:SAM-dependent methyltransferase
LDRRSWHSLGEDFDEQVFDVLGSDLRGVLRRSVDEHRVGSSVAAEFGCGIGRTLPLLASRYRQVYAIDFAASLLEVAQRRCSRLDNVRYVRADLSRTAGGAKKVELALCVNSLLSPEREKRHGLLRSIRRSLAKRSRLVLVVPSLESSLYTNARLIEWNRRAGLRGRALRRESIPATARNARDTLDGIVDLQGFRTKHHLREEAIVALQDARFEVLDVQKVEYAWHHYFERPPSWMGAPLPWDWLLVARRAGNRPGAAAR